MRHSAGVILISSPETHFLRKKLTKCKISFNHSTHYSFKYFFWVSSRNYLSIIGFASNYITVAFIFLRPEKDQGLITCRDLNFANAYLVAPNLLVIFLLISLIFSRLSSSRTAPTSLSKSSWAKSDSASLVIWPAR